MLDEFLGNEGKTFIIVAGYIELDSGRFQIRFPDRELKDLVIRVFLYYQIEDRGEYARIDEMTFGYKYAGNRGFHSDTFVPVLPVNVKHGDI